MGYGQHMFVSDVRFSINRIREDWVLEILHTKSDDEALYECQVSTEPPQIHKIFLAVEGKIWWKINLFIGTYDVPKVVVINYLRLKNEFQPSPTKHQASDATGQPIRGMVFWRKKAGIHFTISDKRWLQL